MFDYIEHMANSFRDEWDRNQDWEREERLDRDFHREPHVRRRHVRNETEHNEQARENVAQRFGSIFTTTGGGK